MVAEGPRPVAETVYWPDVVRAVNQYIPGGPRGRFVQEIWGEITATRIASTTPLPSPTLRGVNRMVSTASGLRRARETLARTPQSDAITAPLIGQQIYARSARERELLPRWHLRYAMVFAGPFGEESLTRQVEYTGNLPATVGELYDDVAADAATRAASKGIDLIDLGDYELGEW